MLEQVPAIAKTSGSVLKAAPGLLAQLRKWREDRKAIAALKDSLGLIDRRSVYYRVATDHPVLQSGAPHPDDFEALCSVLGPHMPRWDEVPEDRDAELASSFSENFVLIGSPEAELLTRMLFGYRSLPNGQGMEFVGTAGFKLPYRWEEDTRIVKARYRRFVSSHGLVERPNWPIVDQRGDSPRSIFPELDGSNFLKTDLLLITKIPNYMTLEGLQSGRSVVSIAGTHGTATRAVELLLSNNRMLAEVGREVNNAQGFQLLCQVSDIRHDALLGSRARRLDVRDIVTLEFSDSEWAQARSNVQRRMEGWGSWQRD